MYGHAAEAGEGEDGDEGEGGAVDGEGGEEAERDVKRRGAGDVEEEVCVLPNGNSLCVVLCEPGTCSYVRRVGLDIGPHTRKDVLLRFPVLTEGEEESFPSTESDEPEGGQEEGDEPEEEEEEWEDLQARLVSVYPSGPGRCKVCMESSAGSGPILWLRSSASTQPFQGNDSASGHRQCGHK